MYTDPMIAPLSVDGLIYALHDEKGRIIGTGTREVCELLIHIMNDRVSTAVTREKRKSIPHSNIRAAIVI